MMIDHIRACELDEMVMPNKLYIVIPSNPIRVFCQYKNKNRYIIADILPTYLEVIGVVKSTKPAPIEMMIDVFRKTGTEAEGIVEVIDEEVRDRAVKDMHELYEAPSDGSVSRDIHGIYKGELND